MSGKSNGRFERPKKRAVQSADLDEKRAKLAAQVTEEPEQAAAAAAAAQQQMWQKPASCAGTKALTLRLPVHIWKALKLRAVEENTSLTTLVIAAVTAHYGLED